MFYFPGMRLAVNRYFGNREYFRFLFHLPYIAFLIAAIPISWYILPLLIGNKIALFAALGFSVGFQFIVYLLGIWIIKESSREDENRIKSSYFLPPFIFLPIASAVASLLIPMGIGKVQWLGISFSVSLISAVIFYFGGVFLVIMGVKNVSVHFQKKYTIPIILYLIVATLVAVKVIPMFKDNLLEISIAFGASLYGFVLIYSWGIVWMIFDVRKRVANEANG